VETLAQLPRWNGCPYVLQIPMTRKPFTGIHVHSLFVVSKALGHSNTLMTQRYSHLSDETLFAAADAAANAIGPSWTDAKHVPA
jgi:hypothetical protein